MYYKPVSSLHLVTNLVEMLIGTGHRMYSYCSYGTYLKSGGLDGVLCRILCEELMKSGHVENLITLVSQVNGRMHQIKRSVGTSLLAYSTVECGYWTETKATAKNVQCRNVHRFGRNPVCFFYVFMSASLLMW